jgi:chromosome segregation ATPase
MSASTTKEIYDVFKSMGAADAEAMNAAFRLAEPEREIARVKDGLERLADELAGLRSDFAGLRSDFAGQKGEVVGLRGDFLKLAEVVKKLQVDAATTRGNISLLTWMVGIVIATLVMPVPARVLGH